MSKIENEDDLIEVLIGNDEGDETSFYIADKADFNEKEYYLAVNNADMEAADEMLILVNTSINEEDLVLEIVDDENLLNEISAIFEERLEDTNLVL